MENNRKNIRFIPLLLSFCFVLSYDWYFFRDSMFGIGSMFNILMLGCIYRLICSGMAAEQRARRYGFVFGFLFSLSLLIGRAMHDADDITVLCASPESAAYALLSLLSFTAAFGCGAALMLEYADKSGAVRLPPRRPMMSQSSMFCLAWVFIFLCWLPVYLAFYPGILSHDSRFQTLQALGFRPYSRFHPPLHTFLWELCIRTEFMTGIQDMVVYSFVQMLLLSAAMARAVSFLSGRHFPRRIVIASALYFALNPSIAIISFSMTKDILFGALMLVTAVELIDMLSDPDMFFASKKRCFAFVFFAALACLFRNNCVYAMVLSVIPCTIAVKNHRRKLLALFAAAFACFMLINGPLYDMLGVKPGSPKELISVPIQQIARVASRHADELSGEDRADIDRFMSFKNTAKFYTPRFADPVKSLLFNEEEYANDSAGFRSLWLRLMRRYPADYVSALLTLNHALWYPDADTVDKTTYQGYISTRINVDLEANDIVSRPSRLPVLLSVYKYFADFTIYGAHPLISSIFSISMPFWLLMSCLFVLLYRREHTAAALAPHIMLWATFIGGPVSAFRYVFPIFIAYPLFIALALRPQNTAEHRPDDPE